MENVELELAQLKQTVRLLETQMEQLEVRLARRIAKLEKDGLDSLSPKVRG